MMKCFVFSEIDIFKNLRIENCRNVKTLMNRSEAGAIVGIGKYNTVTEEDKKRVHLVPGEPGGECF